MTNGPNLIQWVPTAPRDFAILIKNTFSQPAVNPAALEVLVKTPAFVTQVLQGEIAKALAKPLTPPGVPNVPFVCTAGPATAHAATPDGASIEITVWYKPLT